MWRAHIYLDCEQYSKPYQSKARFPSADAAIDWCKRMRSIHLFAAAPKVWKEVAVN